jgi:hypothetical protein
MSVVPTPKEGTTELKRILHVGPKSILLTIHENKNCIHFYIGGTELYCIRGYIIPSSSIFAQFSSPVYGWLSEVRWNGLCSVEGGFIRGFDIRMIVHLLTAYISTNYPWVTGLRFTDTSERICYSRVPVRLADLSFLTTGKTWCENMFGAYIDDDSDSVHKHTIQRFQEIKQSLTWPMMRSALGLEEDLELQTLYDSAITWQEFFGPLQTKMGVQTFCEFAASWLQTFMGTIARVRFSRPTYVMPIQQTPPVRYTVEEYRSVSVGGGRRKRQTRKESYRAGSSRALAIVGGNDE